MQPDVERQGGQHHVLQARMVVQGEQFRLFNQAPILGSMQFDGEARGGALIHT